MVRRPSVVTLDVDPISVSTLRRALRGWELNNLNGQHSYQAFRREVADLVVLGFRENFQETLDLCRLLAPATTDSNVECTCNSPPLLVLLAAEQENLISDVLAAGARDCLRLPIHASQVRRLLIRAIRNRHAGTHTLNLHQPACDEPWRDVGGEG